MSATVELHETGNASGVSDGEASRPGQQALGSFQVQAFPEGAPVEGSVASFVDTNMKRSLIITGIVSFLGGALLCGLLILLVVGFNDQPTDVNNPFVNVSSVWVVNPTNAKRIQKVLDLLLQIPWTLNTPHLAVLLEPGDYGDTELHVGYFTSVSGLGEKPSDVKMGNIRIDTVGSNRGDTTTIFWRTVENMETRMTTWCSQGISFRRILSNSFLHIPPGVNDAAGRGGGSGGFIADCLVRDGHGSNFAAGGQQYFIRNLQANELINYGTGNTLYLGCKGTYGRQAVEVAYIDKTPAIVEKPYIVKDSAGFWKLVKPKLRVDAHGPTFDSDGRPVEGVHNDFIYFQDIFIADYGTSAATINEQIKAGKHIILTPYTHHLDDSIVINRPGTVLLGLGLATLECADQKPCIIVGAVDDVRIAGVIVIGAVQSMNDAWIQIGDVNQPHAGHASLPTVMSDTHAIVGYYRNNSVQSSVQINNGHVIVDHGWSWRSDIDGAHGESRNGFTITGDHVKAYGLFAEHHWQYSLAWYGEFGRSYFFQCETPWDAGVGALLDWTQPEEGNNTWRNWPSPNWYTIQPRCYFVNDSVEHFFGVSVGAYSMEGGGCSTWCGCQEKQALDTHIQIPNASDVTLLRAFCWKNCGGGAEHCINSGKSVLDGQVHTSWCNGMEVPYLGADGAYTQAGAIVGDECSNHDKCKGFMKMDKGCYWTEQYNCPDQPPYNGGAGDDGSIGFECCCAEGYWKQCHGQNCSWTLEYNCPAQPDGSKGAAKDDGSAKYDCCCRQGYWQDMATTQTIGKRSM